jgi:quercetin dioxygenase-like cupin family protein
MYTHFADLLEMAPDIPEDSIISRTLHTDEWVKVILFRFAAGQELSEHTASMPAVLHFLEGEARLTLAGDTLDVSPGTWVYMLPELPHSIHAQTPLTMLLLLLKSKGEE